MATTISQLFAILVLPALVLYLQKYARFIRWIGPIVVCYVVGIIAGNMPFLSLNRPVMSQAAEISICIAIPMLFFTCNFRKWLHHARNVFISFFFAMLAVIIISVIGYFLLKNHISDGWKVAGMLVGVYTGGTANMSAIGIALDVKEEVFVLLNSSDLMFGGIYFLFLLTFGKKVFGYLLPRYNAVNDTHVNGEQATEGFITLPFWGKTVNVLKSLILAATCFSAAVAVSYLVTGKMEGTVIILVLTTLGIAFSFYPPIHRLKGNFETGDYLLLVFALAIGSMADVSEMFTSNLYILFYTALVVFGSAALHVLSSSLFRLEDDAVIITSVAAIFGPAFVAPVAQRIKNREMIIPGISLALLANAMGNYLGLGIAWLLGHLH